MNGQDIWSPGKGQRAKKKRAHVRVAKILNLVELMGDRGGGQGLRHGDPMPEFYYMSTTTHVPWIIGYSDYDVLLESDKGSLVCRY